MRCCIVFTGERCGYFNIVRSFFSSISYLGHGFWGRHSGSEEVFIYFFLINLFILFIFGCVGSSFLCEGFL